jgi:hypothetical protein
MFDPSELPKVVNYINGKSNAVSIEPGDSSISVDNSEMGKIKIKVGGSGSDVVKWENGNTINNPSINLIGGDPTTGNAIHITSSHDAVIDAEYKITIASTNGPIELNTFGSVMINNVSIDINANGITFTNNRATNYGTILLKWGFIGSP